MLILGGPQEYCMRKILFLIRRNRFAFRELVAYRLHSAEVMKSARIALVSIGAGVHISTQR